MLIWQKIIANTSQNSFKCTNQLFVRLYKERIKNCPLITTKSDYNRAWHGRSRTVERNAFFPNGIAADL